MFALNAQRPMTKSLRILSAVLGYPDAQLRSHLPEMRDLLRNEHALSQSRLAELGALMDMPVSYTHLTLPTILRV